MKSIREELHLFVRRFGILSASCCEECCGEHVSMVQVHVLYEIRRVGGASMQQVAEELGIDITTFSRQVKSLEAKGLILRRVSPEDRRVSLLALTPPGEDVMERIDRYMTDRLERIFGSMSPFERETVVRSLGLLNDALARTGCCGSLQDKAVACCKE